MKTLSVYSRKYLIVMDNVQNGYALSVYAKAAPRRLLYYTSDPMRLTVRQLDGSLAWYAAAYTFANEQSGVLMAGGEIETASGSVYAFSDRIEAREDADTFLLTRKTTVKKATDDQGFFTRISFGMTLHAEPDDYQFFGPGAWYGQNKLAPEHFMGRDAGLDRHWYLETRFALPFLTMQNRYTGDTLALCRPKADIKPLDGSQTARVYHSRPDYSAGALGYSRPGGLSLDYAEVNMQAAAAAYTNMNLGSSHYGYISYPGEWVEYRFTPANSGSYTFQSTGSTDTKGMLCTMNWYGDYVVAEDDDSGSGTNFSITYDLQAGTNYKL